MCTFFFLAQQMFAENIASFDFNVSSCPATGLSVGTDAGSLLVWTDTHSAASSTSVLICKPDGTIKKIKSLSRDSQYPATRYVAQFAPAGNDIYLYGGQTYLQEVRDDLIRLSIKGDRDFLFYDGVIYGWASTMLDAQSIMQDGQNKI